MKKICPRCQAEFECRKDSILECQCVQVTLNAEEQIYIADRYNDCLCKKCLEEIKKECQEKNSS